MKRVAVYFAAPEYVEVREEVVPPIGPGQALVKTDFSAVSSGTELLVLRGNAPADLAVDETIAALGGTFGFPVKFGYAAVGHVVEIGEGVASDWLGRRVFAFNPHESHFVAAVADLHPLPVDVAPEAALFLPNMETAVSFLMDARPIIGERVVVFGQGVVGLLTTTLLSSLPLGDVITLDRYALRREWSRQFGAGWVLDPGDPGALEEIRAMLSDTGQFEGADLCLELSGDPAALDMAVALTGYGGRILVGSWYGQKRASLDLGGRFHRAHIQIIGSQVSTLAPQWRGRWTKERRLAVAWAMIRRHAPERLITHRLPVMDAGAGYRLLLDAPGEAIQLIFTYPS